LIKKKSKKISSCNFFQFLVIQTLDLELDPDPELEKVLDPDPRLYVAFEKEVHLIMQTDFKIIWLTS
jgi:hypothetical protein